HSGEQTPLSPTAKAILTSLTGIGLEDPRRKPLAWYLFFETIGDELLGITIPFLDDIPAEAEVDAP
ncbi:MAG: hypothetical protein AAB466_09895, partial [Verrucomicrobiota bacterium]